MNKVVGLFNHYENAEWALEILEHYGIDDDRISVVALDKDQAGRQRRCRNRRYS